MSARPGARGRRIGSEHAATCFRRARWPSRRNDAKASRGQMNRLDAAPGEPADARYLPPCATDGPAQIASRGQVQIGHARTAWNSGRRLDAQRALDLAWQWATEQHDVMLAAEVAIGPEFPIEFNGRDIVMRAQRCEWVLERLPPHAGERRVAVLATLAAAQFGVDASAARATAAATTTAAVAIDSMPANIYARLAAGLTDVAPERVELRIVSARGILADAHAHGLPELAHAAYFLLLSALLESGDVTALDTELGWRGESFTYFPSLEGGRVSRWFGCLRAILDGDADIAQRQAAELLETGERQADPDALSVWIAHSGIIHWMRGSILDAELLFLQARKHEPGEVVWTASLAWLWFLQGRSTAAHRLFYKLPAIGQVSRNRNWGAAAVVYAEIAMLNGDRPAMAELRQVLLPFSDHVVPIGIGVAFWGTAARTLGLLCERLGEVDEARRHLQLAVDVCLRTGAHAWLAEAQIELASFELRQDPESPNAPALLREALSTGESLALHALISRARHGLSLAGPRQNRGAPQIHVMGKFEVLAESGERARWTSRKSRDLLKILVSRRGMAISREVIMEELWPGQDPDGLANRFAVALSTVRRALNPDRRYEVQHFVELEADSLRLRIDRLAVDVEAFLAEAASTELDVMRRAAQQYVGDVFADEPYARWAGSLRDESQAAFCALALRLAQAERAAGAGDAASDLLRRVLQIDPYNQLAHEGLIDALTGLGAHGQAREATERWRHALAELKAVDQG